MLPPQHEDDIAVRSSLFRKYYLNANIDMSVIEFINVVIRIINYIPFIYFNIMK